MPVRAGRQRSGDARHPVGRRRTRRIIPEGPGFGGPIVERNPCRMSHSRPAARFRRECERETRPPPFRPAGRRARRRRAAPPRRPRAAAPRLRSSPTAARSRRFRPTLRNLLLGWSGDPLVWLPAIVALVLWRTGVRRVNRAHPGNPVPRRRTWAWVAGVLAVLFALDSGIERYDTTLFWVHMVQHMLLTLVAPHPAAVRGTDHAAAARLVRRRRAGAGSSRSSTRGWSRFLVVPGRVLAAVRGRDVGEPLLAAVRRGPRGRVDPPAGARAVPGVPRSCSGGRSWGRTRRRGG